MEQNGLSWITNFSWSIADDVLRDLPYAWVAPVMLGVTALDAGGLTTVDGSL